MRACTGRGRIAVMALLMGAAAVAPAGALPFPGTDVRFSGVAAKGNDLDAAVAYNPHADQYLVVWEDPRDSTGPNGRIYGQRVAADGTRLGANFLISDESGVQSESEPAVAFNALSDQYLVVWTDHRDIAYSGKGTEIYGQRLRAGGGKLGGNFVISDVDAVGDETDPAVAWNSNANQYLVVWRDTRANPGLGDIYGQRVKSGGKRAGANFRISGQPGFNWGTLEADPAVVFSATSNQYIVVWSDFRNAPVRGSDIYGARVKTGGKVVDRDNLISGATGDQGGPDVAWNPNANQYLVVWTDWRSTPASGPEIYAQRVKAGGAKAGSDFRVGDATASDPQGSAAVAFSPEANRYLVVWWDERDAATEGSNIYGQWVKAGGATPGSNLLISGLPTDAQESVPDVAYGSGATLHLVVWTDYRDSATRGSDIYGRLTAD